jgi:hypothetical protein
MVTGDLLELRGRFSKGTLAMDRGINLVTGAVLRPRRLHSGSILLITLLLIAFLCMSLYGVFDIFICRVLLLLLSDS